jgi:hypothetical protein
MNERIRELKKQAYELAAKDLETNDPARYYSDRGPAVGAVIDKFSLLMVKECLQTIIDNTPALNPEFDTVWELGYNRAMKDCVHHITEHFGAEE